VFAEHGTVCWLCGHPGADTVDHILPTAHGGTDELSNLRPAHGRGRPELGCIGNYSRGARLWLRRPAPPTPPPRQVVPHAGPSRDW
jgi:hypothetical protein